MSLSSHELVRAQQPASGPVGHQVLTALPAIVTSHILIPGLSAAMHVQASVTKQGWLHLMQQYARAHTRSHLNQPPKDPWGAPVAGSPWIGENLHPDEGWWIARDYMYKYAMSPVMTALIQLVIAAAVR